MSGIAGMIDPRLEREEGEALLERMLRSVRHRGPDHSSSWIEMPVLLGHNQLSIIDVSDRANQPMIYEGLVIVHDGEVYNYLDIKEDLKKRGYKFGTTSDTEVILAAYREWGADCVTRFVGNVGLRHLGQGEEGAVLFTRPVRDQTLLLHSCGRSVLFRLRVCTAEAVPHFQFHV